MSSESDDDFQSADEGSNLDESENQEAQAIRSADINEYEENQYFMDDSKSHENKSVKCTLAVEKSSSKLCYISCEEEVISEKETVVIEEISSIGTPKNLRLQVNEQLTHQNKSDSVDDENEENDFDELECKESPECKFKISSENLLVDSKNYQVGSKNNKLVKPVLIGNKDLEKNIYDETVGTRADDIRILGLACNREKPENKLESVEDCMFENNKDEVNKEVKELITNIKDKPLECKLNEFCDSHVHETVIGVVENKGEKSVENIPSVNQKSKPLRESKIGMKKPREKLGEKLGARKLGSRIEKKPLEGIGSNIPPKPLNHPVSESKSPGQKNFQEEDPLKKEDKKRLQQKSWEQEELRWQQVQNSDGTRKGDKENDDSWGSSWGNWGATLITAASTFTQEVGRGVGNIMETVEGSLGVPDPETLANEMVKREKQGKMESEMINSTKNTHNKLQEKADVENEDLTGDTQVEEGDNAIESSTKDYGLGGLTSLGSIVSGVSGVFETASTKVLLGGLDTLEVIGRKAMDAIQEGDPGLRKKRAFLTNAKPNLSAMLQEARHRAAEEEREQRDGGHGKGDKTSKLQRSTLDQAWDATEGSVHIEALSLVARQCESKMSSMLQSMPHYLVDRIQAANAEIKNICELDEESPLEDDFISRVEEILPLTALPIQPQKINNAWSSVEETVSLIKEAGVVDGPTAERELYTALAALLVQLSAVIHKGAELALITPEADPVTVATQFKELSSVVCGGIENTADQVCGIITTEASAANPQVSNIITNIYLQSASGNSYIQQGMTYLSSVLQYSNTKHLATEL